MICPYCEIKTSFSIKANWVPDGQPGEYLVVYQCRTCGAEFNSRLAAVNFQREPDEKKKK